MRTTFRHRDQPRRFRRLDRLFPWAEDYFLTFCVLNRERNVLARKRIHDRVREFVVGSAQRYRVYVRCYVLMPDHVHLIATPHPHSCEIAIGGWVKALKAIAAQREFRWQQGFADHVLRSEESAFEKWEYIRMNPVRAGLVERPEDWPYGGYFDSWDGEELKAR
jgi:REP element-mobilizing transposase RayT